VHQGEGAALTGTTLSHYRILERIGEGGTSVVYKAEDLSLGRVVALKLLPPSLSVDLGKIARFQHEARTASTLTHPNICTIYEIEQHDGRHFIAMEYLVGQPLSIVIGGRPLESARLVELAIQIADALDAAHAEGIVHRDLKPANIYVTHRDQVKLLDFGLSVLMPFGTGTRTPASATWLAEPGGTVPYMSPEQCCGEQLDTRSDLFSFGVVLYEMATGARPFTGATSTALMDAIRQEHPFPARDLNTGVPDELNRIIEKALEKDRKLRYQTASDVCADLRRLKRDLDSQTRIATRGATTRGSTGQVPTGSPARRATIDRRWAIAQIVAAAAISGALGAFGVPWAHRPPAEPVPDVRYERSTHQSLPLAPPPLEADAAEPDEVREPARPAANRTRNSTTADYVPIEPGRTRVLADLQLQIAQSKIELELYDQALETLTEVARNQSSTAAAPKAYLMKASLYQARGDTENAIATYLEMAARYPTHPRAPEALLEMAQAIMASKRRARENEAMNLYSDIAAKYSSSPWAARALLARGGVEERLKLRQRDHVLAISVPTALVTYRDLAVQHTSSPEREHALWRLARLYKDIGRHDLSAETLTELGERYSSTGYDAWFEAAQLYDRRLHDKDKARAAYAQVPPVSPKYAEAQRRLARR
jgi:tetratricopeptide (TPR) repeat protein/predicted Ser/Thr protein kinase